MIDIFCLPFRSFKMNITDFFSRHDKMSDTQRQYEAVRAVALENQKISDAARTFGYKTTSLKTLINQIKTGKRKLFPEKKFMYNTITLGIRSI